jgi:toxin ParE1/3/4
MSTKWRIRLGGDAERDFVGIISWTAERFGRHQAEVYRDTLTAALRALGAGPDVSGSRARDELGVGVRSLHVARAGRRGSHLLLYRVAGSGQIDVLRILHETMDLIRHTSKTIDQDKQ